MMRYAVSLEAGDRMISSSSNGFAITVADLSIANLGEETTIVLNVVLTNYGTWCMHKVTEDERSACIFKLIIQNHWHTMSTFQLFTVLNLIHSINVIEEDAATVVYASTVRIMMEADGCKLATTDVTLLFSLTPHLKTEIMRWRSENN